MKKQSPSFAISVVFIMISGIFCSIGSVSGQPSPNIGLQVIDTQVNPENGNTYHLLSSDSWEESQTFAEGLGGNLVTINDAEENDWLLEKFSQDGQHIWLGMYLDDSENWAWASGEQTFWENWGIDQPNDDEDEKYSHIIGTEVGDFEVGEWNNIDNDPDYFTIHGVVEISGEANHMLMFDGEDDWIEIHNPGTLNQMSDTLVISASIWPTDTDGVQTIIMKGDHGWGLELIGDKLAYSSTYSISEHPTTSNLSIIPEQWNNISVEVKNNNSVSLFIDNESETFNLSGSIIPQGDFGSNECIGDEYNCNQLVIGRHGMGYDGNYFSGIIENISIGNFDNTTAVNLSILSEWRFNEGHGEWTWDSIEATRSGYIHGTPQWLMHDGSPVTNAILLEKGEEFESPEMERDDQILFYVELPEHVTTFEISIQGNRQSNPDLFISHGWVPTENDFDNMGWGQQSWASWFTTLPEQGNWYILLHAVRPGQYTVIADWEEALPPPEESEMTELFDGIAVTDISAQEGEARYFYTKVDSDLHALNIESWGGEGDSDMISQSGDPPLIGEYLEWGFAFGGEDIFGELFGTESSTRISSGPGNTEFIRYIEPELETWYIVLYAKEDFEDVVLRVDYEYPPTNTEPESAIELFDGVENGPWDSTDEISEYHFFIDVPEETPFLTVKIEGTWGDADIYLRHGDFASGTNHDETTRGTWGVWDSLTINNPQSGKWYIMLENQETFRSVWITASFEEGQIWFEDENRVEIYPNVPIDNLQADEGDTLMFYVDVPDEITEMVVEIRNVRRNTEISLEVWMENGYTGITESDGPIRSVFIEKPVSGIYNIDITAFTGFTGLAIEAKIPSEEIPLPENPLIDEPPVWDTCQDQGKQVFAELDEDSSGSIESSEWYTTDTSFETPTFSEVDRDGNNLLEEGEIENMVCSCDRELDLARYQLVDADYRVSEENFTSYPWYNDFDFAANDVNSDNSLDSAEYRDMRNTCETTWDVYDRDNDGVDNDEDQFPDDPDEQYDTDGDGIGDNSDAFKSIDNDLAYAAAGGLGILMVIFIPIILMLLRGGKPDFGPDYNESLSVMTESKLAMAEDAEQKSLEPIEEVSENLTVGDLGFPAEAVMTTTSTVSVGNVGDDEIPTVDVSDLVGDMLDIDDDSKPDSGLMGSLGSDGNEVLEWPSGSGKKWTRNDAGQDWRLL